MREQLGRGREPLGAREAVLGELHVPAVLDEPVAGVPEGERQQILDTIGRLPADVTVLLIEHDMDLVFNFARTVTVLVNGAVFLEGDARSVSNDPGVRAVYLGEAHQPQPSRRSADG